MSEPTRDQLATQVRYLEAEVTDLRRRLDDVPGAARGLECCRGPHLNSVRSARTPRVTVDCLHDYPARHE